MEKLRKLFPLSFKFCKSVGSLILCAFLYLLIEVGVGILIGSVIEPIVSAVIGTILCPITIIGVILYILGIVLCFTGFGIIIAIPMMIIGIPMMIFASLVTSLVMAVVYSFATVYTMVGCTVAVLAYAGVFGEITFPEKAKKEKEEKKD